VAMAYDINKQNGNYLLLQQASDWWVLWRRTTDQLKVTPDQRVYCFSSVFAPPGLQTKLVHRWQHYNEKTGWETLSKAGFEVAGGRFDGYRGYTYKTGLIEGEWRVNVETENEKTIAVHRFSVRHSQSSPATVLLMY